MHASCTTAGNGSSAVDVRRISLLSDRNALIDKDHWYDGVFYDRVIAPNQDLLFRLIRNRIPAGSTILDVGCGTGRLALALGDMCSHVVGIDLSRRNIERAVWRLSMENKDNIFFAHTSLSGFRDEHPARFDFAVLTYVLHEVPEAERSALLNDLGLIADRVLIGDYTVPLPGGLWTALDHTVEWLAGKEHYRGFRSYVKRGGLAGEVADSSLLLVDEIRHAPRTSQLWELRSKAVSAAVWDPE
jgi:SAM-dependent methyltransferase